MARSEPEFDATLPPFDQFKAVQRLTPERRGHVSEENARHQLYVGRDRQSHASMLIKLASRPGLVYQDNLSNEIATLLTINGALPASRYFPIVKAHGKLRDGRVWLVMSFFFELPLATAIGAERIPGRLVTYLRTALEVSAALRQLHGLQVFHVDLNPMNILLRLEQRGPVVKIIDFESSYEAARHGAGAFYNPPTTPGYSAPEVSRQAPDGRSDLFSLGAVLYTMLAGWEWTWRADVATCVGEDPDLDPDLKAILQRAVAPDPADRYPSIDGFQADLAAYLEGIWPGRSPFAAGP